METEQGMEKSQLKIKNGKIMVKIERDEMEILQAMLRLLSIHYMAWCRKLCESKRK